MWSRRQCLACQHIVIECFQYFPDQMRAVVLQLRRDKTHRSDHQTRCWIECAKRNRPRIELINFEFRSIGAAQVSEVGVNFVTELEGFDQLLDRIE